MGKGEDGGFGEMFASIDVLVMGRGTFEKVMEFDWPYGDKPVIVMSSSMIDVPKKAGSHVRLSACSPTEILQQLMQEGFRHVYVDGGKLVQSFLKEGLVDDMTLTHIPILLGEGISLFGEIGKEIRLGLLKIQSWENGFTQVKYAIEK
jgi:dihydrofolate reductase